MMKFTREYFTYIMRLAKLEFADEEIEDLQNDFSSILTFMQTLQENFLSNEVSEEPDLFSVTSSSLRPDIPENALPKSAVLAAAAKKNQEGFVVPKIL